MGTQTASAKKGTQKDVQDILNEKVMEKLKNGIVPWRVSWAKAGIPENLISGHEYRSINRMLLASLGYERNLFITSNQLKAADGAIIPDERPHVIGFFDNKEKEADAGEPPKETETTETKKKLLFYTVFNIAQCKWPADRVFPDIEPGEEPFQICTPIKSKDQKLAYYDPLRDFINLPGEDRFGSKEEYSIAQFHQLIHSTGHHSRLNRKDLVQMSEFGYDPYSHEELVAEIGTSYLLSHFDMKDGFEATPEYLQGWIQKFEKEKYLVSSAAYHADMAVDYLFQWNTESKQ